MDIFPLTRHLRGFATNDELRDWSNPTRLAVLARLLKGDEPAQAWNALIELLSLTPRDMSVTEPVAMAKDTVLSWPWPARTLDFTDPVLRRDSGLVLSLVGELTVDRVEDIDGAVLGRLASNPYAGNLRGLRLRRLEALPEHIARLLASERLRQLELLELTKVSIGGAFQQVMSGAGFAALKELALIDIGITAKDFRHLLTKTCISTLIRLRLGSPEVHQGLMDVVLASNELLSLEVLDLGGTNVSAAEVTAAVRRRRLPALTTVLLANTPAASDLGPELRLPSIAASTPRAGRTDLPPTV